MDYGTDTAVNRTHHIKASGNALSTRKGMKIDQTIIIIETITETMNDPEITMTKELRTQTEILIMTLEFVGAVGSLITSENIRTSEEIRDQMM